MQITPNQKTDEFTQKIDQVDQQINILQEMNKKDEEIQITFRFLDYCLIEITVNMKSTDHFNTIIEREFQIHDFQLSYKNILIDPYFTLNDYFIPNHSILYVQRPNEHIFIKTNDQNYILYEKNNHSFDFLYGELQSYSKINLHGKLKFFYNDQEIGVKKSFDEIENGSVISCSPPLAFIRLYNFENKSGYKLLTINSVCNLPVILTEKIEQIKESALFLDDDRDIFNENEIILFCNDENLDLNKTFQDYSITDGSEIYYFIKFKSINLEIKEFDLNLSFSTNSLINDVKLKIQEIKGIQIDEQKLFLEHEDLNDYSPLYIYSNKISKIRFYHFREGSKLIYLTFYDKLDYSKFVIFLNDDEKLPIKELKQKFYLYKNIPPAPIKIILNNQVLDDKKVLQDYISPLESESKLNFEVQYDCLHSDNTFYILIERLNNKITMLHVKPNAYIYEIRVLLSLKEGLDFNTKMFCNGRYLYKNESTLQDYQITEGSKIILTYTLRG